MIRVTHSIKTPDSADEISNTPSGTISSTNVQDALNELDGDVTALDASLGTAAVEDVGTSGHTLPFLDGANTWSADQSFTTGIDLGSAVAPGGATDLSRHIALFSTTYGLSVTSNSFNHVASGTGAHNFYSGSTNTATLSTGGALTLAGGLAAGGSVVATGTVQATGTSSCSLIFQDRGLAGDNWQIYSTGNNARLWYSTGGDHWTMTPSGSFLLNKGQLQFPATQQASTNANTLDDYEEGTFTPIIEGTTSAGTGTYTIQTGEYVKLGRWVIFKLRVGISAHTGTGNMRLADLPFGNVGQVSPVVVRAIALTFPASLLQGYVNSSAQIILETVASGAGATALAMDTACDLHISGVYMSSG